ncbi:hypothetical protein AARAC_011977 [Aspergillus arachidicola]|uniref:Myb-like domain-containing protein n=1 Tax=Aspergillus arachidicola TaxID=656916 RepID=A0A2G7EM31_9EURO|nr:hypothetical protein AARAC_011977 [Aspergillus arachidicola]
MQVNLDQIEFYYGPSHQRPQGTLTSTGGNRPALTHAPPPSQHSFFPTEPVFVQAPAPTTILDSSAPVTHERRSTDTTKPRNLFDVEVSNFYHRTVSQPQRMIESNPLATTNIPGILESPLGLMKCPLSLSELPAVEDSAPTSPTKNELEQENALSSNILDTIDAVTSRDSMSESASNTPGSPSMCGDFQQEPVTNATHKPRCSPEHDRHPCPTTTNAPDQTENPEAAEDKSVPPCQPYQSNTPSGSECPASLATSSVDRQESYPSIAVVVTVPPWAREKVTRTTTRIAAVTCKKRLRTSGGGNDHRDPEVSIPDVTGQCLKKPPKPRMKTFHSRGGSDPVLCHRVIHEVRGRAILTVESSGLRPAYYFTFVPDASPILAQTPPVDTLGKQRLYTSEENAMLVRLKERERMSWAEIAAHFPERSASSLQVHYSTKLRHKATTQAGKLRNRRKEALGSRSHRPKEANKRIQSFCLPTVDSPS